MAITASFAEDRPSVMLLICCFWRVAGYVWTLLLAFDVSYWSWNSVRPSVWIFMTT